MANMCNSNSHPAMFRYAYQVSLVDFVATVTFGSLTCWYARSIGGWEGLGIGLNTIIGCGIILAFNVLFALVAALKIKRARWLVLAHAQFLALIAWLCLPRLRPTSYGTATAPIRPTRLLLAQPQGRG
jgi:hypothetical protein